MGKDYNENKEEITLIEIFQLLKRNLYFVIIVTVSISLLTIMLSYIWKSVKTPAPLYQAISKVEVSINPERAEQYQAVIELFKADIIIERSIATTGITEEIEDIRAKVKIINSTQPNVIEIIVANEDQEIAISLANAIKDYGISFVSNAMDLISITLVGDAAISGSILEIEKPVNIPLNTIIAGALGILLSVFFIFIKYALYPKISSEEDIKRFLGYKVLLAIPNNDPPKGIKKYLKIR